MRFPRARSRAQAMVEYALILALAVVLVIVVLTLMGNEVHNMFSNISCAVGKPGGSCAPLPTPTPDS
jgi:Flp pilus assembly pilin Flp